MAELLLGHAGWRKGVGVLGDGREGKVSMLWPENPDAAALFN
jgi:hypothetical protein